MNADVVIIGAGIIGTACAYFLAHRGAKVLVLKRSQLKAGASGATAAIIEIGNPGNTTEALRAINHESYHLILDIAPTFNHSVEMIDGGDIAVAFDEQEVPQI
jgi:sarcosine oxidase subunit beta